MPFYASRYGRPSFGGGGFKGRLVIALVIGVISLLSYCGSSDFNEHTGRTQYVAMSPDQEIALGLQAAPQMAKEFGGLHPDRNLQAEVDAVGSRLVRASSISNTKWNYDFHLLNDSETVNAFALPGGQIFITHGLFSKLSTEGQLAAVLAHEIAHVVARHGAQHLAKQQLTQGLSSAAGVAAGDYNTARMAQMVGQMINMKYGRDDELESDMLGVRFMAESGYDPRSMIKVMQILAKAGGGARQPEFFSTHPNPDNRIGRIQHAIDKAFPQGIPSTLKE